MIEHLTSEQISRWLAGDSTSDMGRHLLQCAQCAAKAGRLKGLLTEFHTSAVVWSDAQKGATPPAHWEPEEPLRAHARGMWRWKLAAAALAVVLAVPVCTKINFHQHKARILKEDVQLWEQVNVQLSRPVPASLEPLMQLMEWEPESTEEEINQGETQQ
jgi:hypothetical protein